MIYFRTGQDFLMPKIEDGALETQCRLIKGYRNANWSGVSSNLFQLKINCTITSEIGFLWVTSVNFPLTGKLYLKINNLVIPHIIYLNISIAISPVLSLCNKNRLHLKSLILTLYHKNRCNLISREANISLALSCGFLVFV